MYQINNLIIYLHTTKSFSKDNRSSNLHRYLVYKPVTFGLHAIYIKNLVLKKNTKIINISFVYECSVHINNP